MTPSSLQAAFTSALLSNNSFTTSMCPFSAAMYRGVTPSVSLAFTSLRKGHLLPVLQKKAVVKNYRPVSNLSFVSKLVERAAVKQLVDYLEVNQLMPKLQSAYRKHHSTETAVLWVLSYILNAMDNQQVTLLALLDLSAAFDCVDHDILLSRLQSSFSMGVK